MAEVFTGEGSPHYSPLPPNANVPLPLPLQASTPRLPLPLHTANTVKIMAQKKWKNEPSLFDQLREENRQAQHEGGSISITSPPGEDHVIQGGRSLGQDFAVAPTRNEQKQKVLLHKRGQGGRKKVLWGKNGMCRGKGSNCKQRTATRSSEGDSSSMEIQVIIDEGRATTTGVMPLRQGKTLAQSPALLGEHCKKSRSHCTASSLEKMEGEEKRNLVMKVERSPKKYFTGVVADVQADSAPALNTAAMSSKTKSVFAPKRNKKKQVT